MASYDFATLENIEFQAGIDLYRPAPARHRSSRHRGDDLPDLSRNRAGSGVSAGGWAGRRASDERVGARKRSHIHERARVEICDTGRPAVSAVHPSILA